MTSWQDNRFAEDLLEHWNDPDVLENALATSLVPAGEAAGRLEALRSLAASDRVSSSRTLLRNVGAPALTVIGERGGITYGQWKSGPAGTLDVDFDYRFVPELDEEERARIERAGKSWSWRLGDDFGEHAVDAGRVISHGTTVDGIMLEDLVLDEDVTTDGVLIFVDVHAGTRRSGGGWSGIDGSASERSDFEPFVGVIRIGQPRFDEVATRGSAPLVSIMAHEIGHVLGIATVSRELPFYDALVDEQAGEFLGSNAVLANGGRPVPFRRQGGEIDWGHLGPCVSLMSYCRDPYITYAPSELDFAFLADIGYEVLEPSVADEPEVYGFGAWGNYSAWGAGVERTIEGTTDRLRGGADAFGAAPGAALADAATNFPQGVAKWAGSLIGVDLGSEKMPPVFGGAALEVNLATLAGNARFDDLKVVTDGRSEPFRKPNLDYDITVTGNSFSDPEGRVRGGFYGPAHEEMAGVLRDSSGTVNLLAGFGGTR